MNYINADLKIAYTQAIENNDFFSAGDILYSSLGAPTFLIFMQQMFSKSRINHNRLKKEAVYLVPQVFEGLCLTTNYDKILDYAYTDFLPCNWLPATPSKSDILEEGRRNGTRVVFKIHGDIDSSVSDLS